MGLDASAIAPADPGPAEGTPSEQPNSPATEATAPANALAGRQAAFDTKAFTQSTQALADIKRELGLDKTASKDDVLAALRTLREQPAVVNEDDLEQYVDPAFAERYRALQNDLWEAQAQIHGDALASEAKALQEAARKMSPAQFIAKAAEFVLRVTETPGEGNGTAGMSGVPEVPSLGGAEPPIGQATAPRGTDDLTGTGRLADFVGRTLFGR